MFSLVAISAVMTLTASAVDQSPACAKGLVLDVRDRVATVCVGVEPAAVGDRVSVRRLSPIAGPSRHPFFVARQVARLRLDREVGEGRVEAALLWGEVRPGDRVAID